MRREITVTQATSWLLSLAVGGASLSLAFLLFLEDREQRALLFALGGLVLTAWTSIRLTDRR
jgi:hypothetical protein